MRRRIDGVAQSVPPLAALVLIGVRERRVWNIASRFANFA